VLACGHAQATGRIGVCVAIKEPGAFLCSTVATTRNGYHVPVLAITGMQKRALLGWRTSKVQLDRLFQSGRVTEPAKGKHQKTDVFTQTFLRGQPTRFDLGQRGEEQALPVRLNRTRDGCEPDDVCGTDCHSRNTLLRSPRLPHNRNGRLSPASSSTLNTTYREPQYVVTKALSVGQSRTEELITGAGGHASRYLAS
jgi:hypothetical protein